MRSDLYWLTDLAPGRLAVAPRPRGGDWLEDEIAAWKRAGVTRVVSLLEADEAADLGLSDEPAAVQAAGIAFEAFPVPDRGLPPSRAAFAEFARRLADRFAVGETVVVHCRQGIGRAGMLAITVLTTGGVPLADAVRRVSDARGRPVPETPDQLRWLAAHTEGTP